MRKILGSLLVVITSLVLISCEHDVDFDKNSRTMDVTEDNAELIALGALQSTLLAYRYAPLFDFLDGSDLPDDADGNGYTSTAGCGDSGGQAYYTFSRQSLEPVDGEPDNVAHKVGDTISVEYTDCDNGEGLVFNGKLSASYSNIEGLNDRFVEIDTDTCVANLQESLAGEAVVIDPTVVLNGDEVRFRNEADTVVVEVVQYSVVDDVSQQEVTDSFVVGKDETAIIVNRKSVLAEDAMTSVDVDQVFSIIDRKGKEELCQGYQRTLVATLTGFSVDRDDLQVELNGSIKLVEGTDDLNTFVNEIRDSRFVTTVRQGSHIDAGETVWHLTNDYSFSGFSATTTYDQTTQAYAYRASGEISSDAIFGTAEITTPSPLLGDLTKDYPDAGTLTILGQGLERLGIVVNGQHLKLQVDFNGDSTGSGFPDVDTEINTTWEELLSRDFQSAQ